MKKFTLLIFSIVCVGSFSFANAAEVGLFRTHITVEDDGSFLVSEEIYYDFFDAQKEGIERVISTVHPQSASVWYKSRYVDIEMLSVERNEDTEPFVLTEGDEELLISIGEPGELLTGRHAYRVTYRVRGGLSYFLNEDSELFWSATGDAWNVLLRRVEIELADPDDIFLGGRACYRGVDGDQGTCNPVHIQEDGDVLFTAQHVFPHEAVVFTQSISQAKVENVLVERIEKEALRFPIIVTATAVFIFLGILFYKQRREKKGFDLQEEVSPVE